MFACVHSLYSIVYTWTPGVWLHECGSKQTLVKMVNQKRRASSTKPFNRAGGRHCWKYKTRNVTFDQCAASIPTHVEDTSIQQCGEGLHVQLDETHITWCVLYLEKRYHFDHHY
jgi:hypothetical protein